MTEQTEFSRAQGNGLSASTNSVRADIHLDVLVTELLSRERGANTPENRLDAGDKLAGTERLGDIIVRASLEATDAIAFLAASSEHDDRSVCGFGATTKPPANFEARDPFDHPVEDNDVRRLFRSQQQRFLAVTRATDIEVLALEMPDKKLRERTIVLDEQ
jgi:hypothetical protein